jgi:4-amino-4-deoxy-L-arabinose transferase-like glycosyltransferase
MTLAEPPSELVHPPAATETHTRRDVGLRPAVPETRVRRPWERALEIVLLSVAVAATAVGVALRFTGPRALWLDEALTVNISRLPLTHLFDALRHDGSPPAYYVLLHYWMGIFGTGTRSVRALAGVCSVLALPLGWRLGSAVGGRRAAVATVVVLACNPFALRYGTENRMYSLVMLLALAACLALVRTLQRPTLARLISFGLLCGLLLLTHYWALYLVAALGMCLFVASLRGPIRAHARLALVALCAGGLVFLPWAPSFLFQVQHTGTPWATPVDPSLFVWTLGEFAGWGRRLGIALFVLYCVLLGVLVVAVVLRRVPAAQQVGDAVGWRRAVPGTRFVLPAAALFMVTLGIALVGGLLDGAAFAYRYSSVVLPLIVLLVALGITAVDRSRLGTVTAAAVLAAVALLGTATGSEEIMAQRTQAVEVAAEISAYAHPGDVVAYCPDQLGPALSRLLPERLLTQVTFPRFDDPQRINWVDYARVNAAANPGVFANEILNMAAGHQIWLVWEAGYLTLGSDCEEILDALEVARPRSTEPVVSDPARYYEHESLVRFSP